MKKLISMMLALCLLCSVLAVTAYAEESAYFSVTASAGKVNVGDKITVTVSTNSISECRGLQMTLNYDPAMVKCVGTSIAVGDSINDAGGFVIGFIEYINPTSAGGQFATATFEAIGNGTVSFTVNETVATAGEGETLREIPSSGGSTSVEIVKPHVHGEGAVQIPAKDATCTEAGNKEYYQCGCGALFADAACTNPTTIEKVTIPAKGHDWGDWNVTKEPSCADGEKEHTCKTCGKMETEVIDATGNHKWGEWKVTTAATCEKKGTQTRSCSICGESQSQTNIPALGHDFESWVKLDDNSHTHTCKRSGCGKTETAAHTWEKIDHKDPNCRDDGYDRFRCPDCEAVKTQVLKSTGEHGFNTWTDNKDGKTHHSICDGCGVEKKTEDHTWDKEEITKQPTCSAKGEKTYTCKCGAVKTEEIPATGEHTYSNGKWEKNDAETHKMKCDHCDNYKTAKHNWDKGVVTEKPTCSKEGTKVFTCKDCKETRTEKLPATGKHDYTDKYEKVDGKTHKAFCDCGESIVEEHKKSTFIKVIQKPTSSTKGLELWACACGYEMEVETPAISGNYDNVPKTGDITGQIILAGFCVVAVLSGMVYGIKRKITR